MINRSQANELSRSEIKCFQVRAGTSLYEYAELPGERHHF